MEEEIIEEKIIEDEYEVNEIVYESYIASACSALNSMAELDVELMNQTERNRVRSIKRKSLKIIHECINAMHDELFGDEVDN